MSFNRCRFFLLVVCLAATFSFAPSALTLDHPDPPFDLEAFRALSPTARIDFMIARLEERDAALRNIDYTVLETHTGVAKADGARHYQYKSVYHFRRLDNRMWIHMQEQAWGDPNAPIREEWFHNWDGKICRGLELPPYSQEPNAVGQIFPKQANSFVYHRFLAISGLRLKVTDELFPLTQWLRDNVKKKDAQIDATDVVREGVVCLKLTLNHVPPIVLWRRELWLDPARGFMPVQFDQVYNQKSMHWLMQVSEAQQCAGVWIPKRVIGKNSTDTNKSVGETIFDVQDFKIGTVKDHDLDVVFPRLTFVVDGVDHIAYRILKDGRYQLEDVVDGEKNILHEAPAGKIVDHIDESTPKLYKSVPIE